MYCVEWKRAKFEQLTRSEQALAKSVCSSKLKKHIMFKNMEVLKQFFKDTPLIHAHVDKNIISIHGLNLSQDTHSKQKH